MASNPFYVEPGNQFGNQLAGLGAVIGDYRQKVESEERKREAEGAIKGAYRSGDPKAIAETMIQYPEYRDTLSSLYGFKSDATKQNAIDTYKSVLANKQNPQGALDALNARIDYVTAQGGDPSNVTVKARDQLQSLIASGQDPSSFFRGAELDYAGIASPQEWNAYAASSGAGSRDVQQAQYVEGLGYVQQLRNGQVTMAELSPDQQAKVKLALDAQAKRQAEAYGLKTRTGLETKLDLEPTIKGAEETAVTESQTRGKYKDQAIAAAENVPTLKRAIQLQKEIMSGGGANSLRKVANYLGVSSADEGELNSLFGQNILGQLKSTFGGNPTEGERQALEQAQASFSQTGKINVRLLENALKLADLRIRRGKSAANKDKDQDTIKYIDDALSLEFGDENQSQGGSGSGSMTPGINQQSSSSGWSIRPLGK